MAQIHALNTVIILVDPQMPQNIGASARAMANFGFSRLRLVRPRGTFSLSDALPMAAGADHVIEDAQIFETLSDALHDCTFSAAFTARPRQFIKPIYTPHTVPTAFTNANALVFGGERAGLNNTDIALCQTVVHVQTVPNFSSLNLAQCVLLACAQIYAYDDLHEPQLPNTAPGVEIMGFIDHLTQSLEQKGYFSIPEKKESLSLILHNMIARARFTSEEIRTWRGIIRYLMKSMQS